MLLDSALKGHFLNLYHMALSDSKIHATELELLYKIGEEKGICKSEIEQIVLHPDSVSPTIPGTVQEKIEYLYDFARIVWADGKVEPGERSLMEVFCGKFGFLDDNIPSIVEFLLDEVEKGSSKEQIFQFVSENAS